VEEREWLAVQFETLLPRLKSVAYTMNVAVTVRLYRVIAEQAESR